MKAFGIEIRKANTIGNLYSDVNRVLDAHGLSVDKTTRSVQVMAVSHALHKMMRADGYFDVCTIRSCVDVCQVFIPEERMCIYRTAHCIHWNQMETDYRQILMAMVLDDFKELLNPAA